mmetsp:Transcript_24372/g.44131  ORF Transcript_24372/g.44131 Transcript_24372/m.44131 type:complete len:375 (-) Transcript_24372:100-1224(-)
MPAVPKVSFRLWPKKGRGGTLTEEDGLSDQYIPGMPRPRPAPEKPKSPGGVTAEKMEQYFSKMWKGNKGETYSFEPCGDKTWTCIRKDPHGGLRKFTVWLDEHSGLVWWGSMFYYFDPKDWIDAPRRVAWYSADDKQRRRAKFVWEAADEALEDVQTEVVKTESGVQVDVINAENNANEESPPSAAYNREVYSAYSHQDLASPPRAINLEAEAEAQQNRPREVDLEEDDAAAPGCGPGWYPPPGLTQLRGTPWASARAGGSFSFFRGGRFRSSSEQGTASLETQDEATWQSSPVEDRPPTPPPGLGMNPAEEVGEVQEKMGRNKMGRNKIGSNILTNLKAFRPFGSPSFRPSSRAPGVDVQVAEVYSEHPIRSV